MRLQSFNFYLVKLWKPISLYNYFPFVGIYGVSLGEDDVIAIWQTGTGKCLWSKTLDASVDYVRWNPRANQLAYVTDSNKVVTMTNALPKELIGPHEDMDTFNE